MAKKINEIELVIGDLHYDESRKKAIELVEQAILITIKGMKFARIILLGDLFHKKPTAAERCMLAAFLNKLRKHTKSIDFIIGNGRHTFEAEAIHEQDWIDLCKDFYQHEELTVKDRIFCHSEFKGLKYVNGHESESTRELDPKYTYYSGHIHSPECSFKNVNYVGSIYKVTFSEMDDQKRIAIITEGKVKWIDIPSRPMFQLDLIGVNGKVKAAGLKELKTCETKDIDLKIKAKTDSVSLNAIHRAIAKIKKAYQIEYYREEIYIKEIKTDIPEDMNPEPLLRKYCKLKKVPFNLVEQELKK